MPKIQVKATTGLSIDSIRKRMASGGAGMDPNVLFLGNKDIAHVRFLTEPDEWVFFTQHFNEITKAWAACIGEDEGCVFCAQGENGAQRAAANVFVYQVERAERKGNKAGVMKLNKNQFLIMSGKVQEVLTNRFERRGTLTNVDVDIIRSGEQQQTTYAIEWDSERTPITKAMKRGILDIPALLQERTEKYYEGIGGLVTKKKKRKSDDDEDDDDISTRRKKRTAVIDEDEFEEEEFEDEEEEEDEEPPKKRRRR